MDNSTKIGIFDQVRLVTTRRVSYLSAPPSGENASNPTPSGIWSVTAAIGNDELLVVQNNVVIKIPAADVLKIADYSIEKIIKNLGNLSNGKSTKKESS